MGAASAQARVEGGVLRFGADSLRDRAAAGEHVHYWRTLAVALVGVFGFTGIPAVADSYPTRPVSLIVPFPPGGGNDAMARMIAEKLSKALGQQVVVDNRGGAGGGIGTRAAAKSAADGYTLLLAFSGTLAINPSLYANVGYDPQKDFAPIGLIASSASVLVVHPSFPAKTVAELIAYAKQNPGKIDYASSGVGTVVHVSMEMFANIAGIDVRHIPYKGTGPAVSDLLGGHVSMMMPPIQPVIGNIRAGQLRALAVASPTRSSLLPDVPTIEESGLRGYTASMHYGLVAPAGTPDVIIERLNKELNAALALPELRERLASEGAETLSGTPAEYSADIARDQKLWGQVVKKLGLKVE